jgi:hypothetical protein
MIGEYVIFLFAVAIVLGYMRLIHRWLGKYDQGTRPPDSGTSHAKAH